MEEEGTICLFCQRGRREGGGESGWVGLQHAEVVVSVLHCTGVTIQVAVVPRSSSLEEELQPEWKLENNVKLILLLQSCIASGVSKDC